MTSYTFPPYYKTTFSLSASGTLRYGLLNSSKINTVLGTPVTQAPNLYSYIAIPNYNGGGEYALSIGINSYPFNGKIHFLYDNILSIYSITSSRNQYVIYPALHYAVTDEVLIRPQYQWKANTALPITESSIPLHRRPMLSQTTSYLLANLWVPAPVLNNPIVYNNPLGMTMKNNSWMIIEPGSIDEVSFVTETLIVDPINPSPTPTHLPTNTPTRTPYVTVTPTRTPNPTYTVTPTKTKTPTPTGTRGLLPTPTKTPSNTPTKQPNVTPSGTSTPTPTPTKTKTPTPTASRLAPGASQTPTPTQTRTPGTTPGNTPTPTQTKTPTPTRPRSDGRPTPGSTDTTSYPGFILYTATCFPIYAMFRTDVGLPAAAITEIKKAVDRWSCILNGTVLPDADQPPFFTRISPPAGTPTTVANPLKFKNNGFVIMIDQVTMGAGVIAAANYHTSRSAASDRNTTWFGLPATGSYACSTVFTDKTLTNVTAAGKTECYYTALHEIGHALGIGTAWRRPLTIDSAGILTTERNFLVKYDDAGPNPAFGIKANQYYTNVVGDKTDTGTFSPTEFTTVGGFRTFSNHRFAFNPNTSKSGAFSRAAEEYNTYYGTTLSAVPVENQMGVGSYGGHWAEGFHATSYTAPWAASAGTAVANLPGLDQRAPKNAGGTVLFAPCMQDELMTPISAGTFDAPVSRVTLGALEDLGWVVDMSQADNYEPFKHIVQLEADNSFSIKRHNFGGFAKNMFQYALRRGSTYTFVNNTGFDFNFFPCSWNSTSNTVSVNTTAQITTGVTKNGSNISIAVPANFASMGIAIVGTKVAFPGNTTIFFVS